MARSRSRCCSTGSCSIGGHVEGAFHAGSIGLQVHMGNPTNSVGDARILCSNSLLVQESDSVRTEKQRYISAGSPKYRRDAIQQHLEVPTVCT